MWHIIGADGYIGTKLREYLPSDIAPICYDLKERNGIQPFNLLHPEMFDFSQIHSGDYVVFLAAISSPDICKNQYDYAYSINVTGTRKYLQRFSENGVKVLFFSSDVVYGATDKKPVTEEAICRPCGPYAEMKHEIETLFAGNPFVKVFRLSYVFSREDRFSMYLEKSVQNDCQAEVYDTLYRNVIYIQDIFDAVIALADNFDSFNNQVFNLSGPELLSRRDLAEKFRQNVASNLSYVITDPPVGFFDARPQVIATKSLYLNKLLKRTPTAIENAMKKEFLSISK